jgi:hypothetical protein
MFHPLNAPSARKKAVSELKNIGILSPWEKLGFEKGAPIALVIPLTPERSPTNVASPSIVAGVK